ncbi:ammonia permease [Bacillus sp. 17RED48]|uniref:ammonia permease n=1 Tax=Bacillus sp. 17RED48 TaxID=2778093 RepID=UPI001C9B2070|nr:ammonia permease [Bacillus sp. 17RED48]MBY7115240.1 ammonia permease [Bacillus sp. 17RED48]
MYILGDLWIFFIPIFILCGFIGGLFLIITGIENRKLLVGVMGLLSLSLVVLPFTLFCMGIGNHEDKILPYIPNFLYFILYSLSGLLAGFNGLQAKIKSIRNMGFIIFAIGILGAVFYYLMTVSNDSFYIY